MNPDEPRYALEPRVFHSMDEAQALSDALEENLHNRGMGNMAVRSEVVELFSGLVNNAAGHGLTQAGAAAHVRHMPHRMGHALDMVVVDSGPGIRATLANNPGLPKPETDQEALALAAGELVSGTGDPTRGIGLWMTVTAMRKPGRKLWIHSGSGLLAAYGNQEPVFTQTGHRQGVMARLTIPV